jgi:hypothetical protein
MMYEIYSETGFGIFVHSLQFIIFIINMGNLFIDILYTTCVTQKYK